MNAVPFHAVERCLEQLRPWTSHYPKGVQTSDEAG